MSTPPNGDLIITDQPLDIPPDAAAMIICPGRWFYGLALADIEPTPGSIFKFGGDIIFMLWRLESNPTGWLLNFRFRRNAGPNNSPWNGLDKKSWFCERVLDGLPKEGAVEAARGAITRLAASGKLVFGEPDWLVVEGDWREFLKQARNQKKPWMHVQGGVIPPPP